MSEDEPTPPGTRQEGAPAQDTDADPARGGEETTAAVPAGEPGSEPEKPGDDEVGGPRGPEPTRFGDWERKGRCIDF